MIFRKLILAVTLLSSAFGSNFALSSSNFQSFSEAEASRVFAQKSAPNTLDSAYKLSLPKPVQDKNFFLLSLFQRNREVRKLLSRNERLRNLTADKLLTLKQSANCKDVGCFDQLMRFDGPTIDAVANALQTLA